MIWVRIRFESGSRAGAGRPARPPQATVGAGERGGFGPEAPRLRPACIRRRPPSRPAAPSPSAAARRLTRGILASPLKPADGPPDSQWRPRERTGLQGRRPMRSRRRAAGGRAQNPRGAGASLKAGRSGRRFPGAAAAALAPLAGRGSLGWPPARLGPSSLLARREAIAASCLRRCKTPGLPVACKGAADLLGSKPSEGNGIAFQAKGLPGFGLMAAAQNAHSSGRACGVGKPCRHFSLSIPLDVFSP